MCEQEIILHKIAKTISELSLKDNKYLIYLFFKTGGSSFRDFFKWLVSIIVNNDIKSEKIRNILSSERLRFRVFVETVGIDRIVTITVSVSISITSLHRHLKLLDRFFISQKMFRKLKSKYIKIPSVSKGISTFEKELYKLLYRYSTLWQYQSFLSEENLLLFREELDCSLECFSCPLYRVYESYCSMFEEDRVFGSFGNFFDFVDHNMNRLPEMYTHGLCMELNPPFIAEVVDKTINKMIDLILIDIAYCFILTIPDWFSDKLTKLYGIGLSIIELHPERLNFTLYTKNFQRINYYKTSVTIAIIRNKKGEIRYPVTEDFIQKLIDINKSVCGLTK